MKTFFTILITTILAVTATWFFTKNNHDHSSASTDTSRKVLYYQSAMHPWIKSDKPGNCTICGMDLTPVYEGEKGMDAGGDGEFTILTQTQVQVLNVATAEAKVQPLTRTLKFAGTIENNHTLHRMLSAYVDSRIEKLHVNYIGAEVEEGQLLATIYSPTLLQAEREYRRLTGEVRHQVKLRLRQLGLTDEQIAAIPNKPIDALTSEIHAPKSGTVIAQSVREGQYVEVGDSLFEIADFSHMWFLFDVYEQDLPWIHVGQELTLATPSLPGETFSAKVSFIDPNTDPVTRSTTVRVELENPLIDGRRKLLNGLYAEATLKVESPATLAIPRSAIIQTGTQAVAYIARGDGAYEQAPLELGARGDSMAGILSGVEEGDRVVTNGNLLIDGQAEMDRSFATETPMLVSTTAPAAKLTDAQEKVLNEFFATTGAMTQALADDNLEEFNKVSEPAMDQTAAFLKTFEELAAEHPVDKKLTKELDDSRHFHGFKDIQAAREAYHRFSMATAALLDAAKEHLSLSGYQLFQCPMVDEAIPNAPARGYWLQLPDTQIANPYFGAKMLRCGGKVK